MFVRFFCHPPQFCYLCFHLYALLPITLCLLLYLSPPPSLFLLSIVHFFPDRLLLSFSCLPFNLPSLHLFLTRRSLIKSLLLVSPAFFSLNSFSLSLCNPSLSSLPLHSFSFCHFYPTCVIHSIPQASTPPP